eukprot:scaffold87949_cov21-Tisochrysis_lutea.AAC.2
MSTVCKICLRADVCVLRLVSLQICVLELHFTRATCGTNVCIAHGTSSRSLCSPCQIGLKLATLGGDPSSGGSSTTTSIHLLDAGDEAMLLSWVALVLITAQE